MNNKEVSRSYEGPLDAEEALENILARYKDQDETVGNDIRIAFQLGKEQGKWEAVCPMRCCEGLPVLDESKS